MNTDFVAFFTINFKYDIVAFSGNFWSSVSLYIFCRKRGSLCHSCSKAHKCIHWKIPLFFHPVSLIIQRKYCHSAFNQYSHPAYFKGKSLSQLQKLDRKLDRVSLKQCGIWTHRGSLLLFSCFEGREKQMSRLYQHFMKNSALHGERKITYLQLPPTI